MAKRPFTFSTEMTFKESFKASFVLDAGLIVFNVYKRKANIVRDVISDKILKEFVYYYTDLYEEIMDKYHNTLRDSIGYDVFEREMNKRSAEIDKTIPELVNNISANRLEETKNSISDIKGYKFKVKDDELIGDYDVSSTPIVSVNTQAKYEKEFYFAANQVIKLSKPILIVSLAKKILSTHPTTSNGKEYIKLINELKQFLNSKVVIGYAAMDDRIDPFKVLKVQ